MLLLVLLLLMVMVVLAVSVRLVFALDQNLLARYPPALPVFLGEQRLVVPFGGFGRVGHVRVAFGEDFDGSLYSRLLLLLFAGGIFGGLLVVVEP
jgi:hypothetical protein